MADKKISALTGATTPLAGTEVLPIVQGGSTVKVATNDLTVQNIRANATTGILQVSGPTAGTTWTVTVPDANWTAARTDAAQTFNGQQTLSFTGGNGPRINRTDGAAYIDFNQSNNAAGMQVGTDGTGALAVYTALSGSTVLALNISSLGITRLPYYGAGTATFSATGVISSVSDETWKIKDGVPVNPVEMIEKLQPGYWYYNKEKSKLFGTERQLGFYAQNVNAAIGPEAAPEPEEGKSWGYYDRSVLTVTVLALQDALKRIETLETQLKGI